MYFQFLAKFIYYYWLSKKIMWRESLKHHFSEMIIFESKISLNIKLNQHKQIKLAEIGDSRFF